MTRHWILPRSTSGGHSSFPGGSVTDLQSADDITTVLLPAAHVYPQTCVDSVTLAGYTASTASFSNATHTQAGAQTTDPTPEGYSPVLSGSSTNVDIEVGLSSAGTYRLWAGYGSLSAGNTERALMFEGSADAVADGVSGLSRPISISGLGDWTASQSVAEGVFKISTDLSIWEKVGGGTQTCGATPPDATGKVMNDTVSDGTVTWTYTGRKALAKIAGTTTVSPYTIADQNGVTVGATVWDPVTDSPPVEAAITGAYGRVGYCVLRTGAARFRFVGHEALPVTLEDLNIFDVLGNSMTIGSPKLYAQQPIAGTYKNTLGKAVLYFNPNTGASTLGAYSLTGTLASYFEIVDDLPGDIIGLRQLVTIPDAMAGLSQTLGIIQTSAGATGSPYTTWIEGDDPLEVVSSQGRPYNDETVWGSVRTETWLRHKAILDEHDATLWTSTVGAADPAWDTDVAVNSDAAMRTAMDDARLASIASGRTTNHRVRLMNGTYDASGNFTAAFGTGQLRIEPDTGHDPTFNSKFPTFNVAGIHLKNLLIAADQAVQSAGWQFVLSDPGAGGIASTGDFGRYVFENCRMGIGHVGGIDDLDIDTRGNAIFSGDIAESVYVVGADIDCGDSASLFGMYGVRSWFFDDVVASRMIKDFVSYSGPPRATSTTGIWADSNIYGRLRNITIRCEPDDATFSSEAHADGLQARTVEQNASFWWAENVENDQYAGVWNSSTAYGVTDRVTHSGQLWKRPTGSEGDSVNEEPGVAVGAWQTSGAGWTVGDQCFVRETGKWLVVDSLTTAGGAIAGLTGATPPDVLSSADDGTQDGGVVWDFLADNDIAGEWHVSAEKFFMVSARTLSAQPATRQWRIGSNGGHGSREIFVGVDIINAHLGDKGAEMDEGEIYLEYALMAGPPALNASHAGLFSTVHMNNSDSFAMLEHCIFKQDPTQPDAPATPAPIWKEDCEVVSWTAPGSVGSRPQDFLGGTFSQVAWASADDTWGYAFTDSRAVSKETYDAALIGQLYTVTGTAGAFSTPEAVAEGGVHQGRISLSLALSL